MTQDSGVERERDFSPAELDVERVGRVGLPDEEATRQLGARLAELFSGEGFIGLVGPLGAGKTTLVKGFVSARDAEDVVARSPTYTLLNVYRTTPPIVHVDLYRLEGIDGLESTGYWDYIRMDRRNVLVEWFDRVTASWPGSGLIVELAHRQSGRWATLWASESYMPAAQRLVSREDSAE